MISKKYFTILIVLALTAMLAGTALASYSEISWRGQGTDSMDCTKYGPEGGMHWVLTGTSKVAKLPPPQIFINGGAHLWTKWPGPTIHFDTPYYPLEGLTAKVVYSGTLAKNALLVISDYCPGYKPLEAEKTAAGSYDRTVEWELDKSVDQPEYKGYAGEFLGVSTWKVVATKTETLDNYLVKGMIKIYNPNVFAAPFTVTDVLDDGTVAVVECPAYIIPAKDTLTCTYKALPKDSSAELNTATVESYVGGAIAESKVPWEENLIGYDEGTLSDPRFDYKKLISASTTVEFPEKFECPADPKYYKDGMYEYTEVNSAFLLKLEASAKVTVRCLLPALEVKKTAAGEWDRKVTWELDKSVAPDTFSGFPNDTFDAIWKVVATKHDSGPMNFLVTGDITITNPAFIPQTFDLEDVLTGAREDLVKVDCPAYTVPAGEKVVCTYEASQPDATATLNIVTVTADGNKPQVATAEVKWKENLDGYDEGTLTDPRFKFEEVISASTIKNFPETFACPPAESGLYVGGYYSFEAVNWAYLNGNLNLSASAKVTVDCRLPVLQTETAWGGDTGFNIMSPGQWWYIFDTAGPDTQTIWAGQTIPVGTVTVSEAVAGYRTITINLTGGWMLQGVAEPVKIQGYNVIPGSAPIPGLFTTYKGSELVISVPDFAFYAIHLDVGIWK
jgi:VCBS repeat-containing protein